MLFNQFTLTWYGYLRNPLDFWRDFKRTFKFAYQRLTRGWDDSWSWDMHGQLSKIIPEILKKLKEYESGFPVGLSEKDSLAVWHKILDEIAEGFYAAQRISGSEQPAWQELWDEWDRRYPGEDWHYFERLKCSECPLYCNDKCDYSEQSPCSSWNIRSEYEDLEKELGFKNKLEEQLKEDMKKFHRGMILFHQHFFNLWD